jgi:hypothetical protein
MTEIVSRTDVDLLRAIKSGDKEAEYLLFRKYRFFIVKHYRHLYRMLPEISTTVSFSDFENEVYLTAFRKAIVYADLKKIRDENWRIVQILSWYTSNLISEICQREKKKFRLSSDTGL